jgi:TIR domain/Pentapeptide repeats (8 copies)
MIIAQCRIDLDWLEHIKRRVGTVANEDHTKRIKKGRRAWNEWRAENPAIRPDLSGADLTGLSIRRLDLSYADLRGTNLLRAQLSEANFRGADLTGAILGVATLINVDFSDAILNGTDLVEANLSCANLGGADLSNSHIGLTTFGNNDLSLVKGLESTIPLGPITIGVDTLYKSQGKIPVEFLSVAGIPGDFITQIPSLIAGIQPIQFHSCFISYSHQDEQFSQQLHSRMRDENLRVWYAPQDMKAGRKLHEEIFRAIEIHDKLLLVLSESSMRSEWVMTEIRRARKVERDESRRKLFPIRLVDFESIQKWECFDAGSGKDLAVELREYYIPDFSNWKDPDAFEAEFSKLLRDLRATETSGDWRPKAF